MCLIKPVTELPGSFGAAMACYDRALQYSLFRKQFHDAPIASHQLRAGKADVDDQRDHQGAVAGLASGRLKDQDKVQHQQSRWRSEITSWHSIRRLARDILGANGVADEYPIFRHMANLESVKTYEGTHDIHTLIIGQS